MEAPGFLFGGYFGRVAGKFSQEKKVPDQNTCENFTIDDLLDLSSDDMIVNDDFFENVTGSTASSTVTALDSSDSSFSASADDHSASFGHRGVADDSHFSADLVCVPDDEMAELEWFSNFIEDSFSAEQNLNNLHILSGSKPPTPDSSSSSCTYTSISQETPRPGRVRSKRSRVAPSDWSTRLLILPSKTTPTKNRERQNPEAPARKCLHCAAESTPQWRTGPMGSKTLCNACGVRYKSGRLVPEYRPAASPTFVSTRHSNSHRKVMELRRQKELQTAQHQQQQQQLLSQSSIFGVSDGGAEFLINHNGGAEFWHVI